MDKAIVMATKPVSPVGVAALCREPAGIVRQFIRNCLASGFQSVRVYIDGSADPSFDQSKFGPQVIVVECDDDFWMRTNNGGIRPIFLEQRQRICFEHAYQNTTNEQWIAFCDADEMFVPPTSFVASLDGFPSDIHQVSAETCEVFWDRPSDIDTRFSGAWGRVPSAGPADSARLENCLTEASYIFRLLSTRGLVGHSAGKCRVRTGLEGFSAGNHWHFSVSNGKRRQLKTRASNISLLHFDAVSFGDWKRKHLDRAEGKTVLGARMDKRRAQSDIVLLCGADQKKRDLFWQLYGASDGYLSALYAAGFLRKIVRS